MTCAWSWNSENPFMIIVDVLISTSAIIVLVCVEWALVRPFKSIGFYCHDPKLRFKYEGDTITEGLLITVSLLLPWLFFMIVEWTSSVSLRKGPKDDLNNKLWKKKARYWYFQYLFGLCFTFLITDLIKLLIGEPRPHFFDTCVPDKLLSNCSISDYVTEYKCTRNLPQRTIVDSYKSFPSGHSAFSCFLATFMVRYFAHSVKTDSQFLVYFLQLLCIFWALLCCFSRITDHRHHWWDVMGGSVLGTTVALYFYRNRNLKRISDVHSDKDKNFQSHLINSHE